MSLTAAILARHRQEWQDRAISSPFLSSVTDGTVSPAQFNAWLVQDGLFVREFTRFLGACLAKAPHPHFDLLLAGAAALKDELAWFQVWLA